MISKGCDVAKQTVREGKLRVSTEDDKIMTKECLVCWGKKGRNTKTKL